MGTESDSLYLEELSATERRSDIRRFPYHHLFYGKNKSAVYPHKSVYSPYFTICHDLWLHQCICIQIAGTMMGASDRKDLDFLHI